MMMMMMTMIVMMMMMTMILFYNKNKFLKYVLALLTKRLLINKINNYSYKMK